MSEEPEEELDLSAGMVPHHPLGPISGFDHETGLPIVKRQPQVAADEPVATVVRQVNPARPAMATLAKGQPVTLPDGSKGRVAHLIDNMKTVRVRTDDGRNLTVRQSALKPADSVLVKEHYRSSPS